MTDVRRGVIAGVVAYGLWGLFPIYFHALAPASPFEVLVHRMVWTLVVTGGVLAVRRDGSWLARLRAQPAMLRRIALGAVMLWTNWTIYIWAATNGHVVDAALGYFVNPLVTVALGTLILGEHLRPLQRVAVALGSLAVVVLTIAVGRPPWIALALALSFAAYGYLKKAVDLPSVPALCVETAVLMPLAVGIFVVLRLRGGTTFTGHGAGHSLLLLAAGIVTAVPLVLFGVAARRIPLTLLGLLQYLTPVMQMLCGVVLFHESVPAARWVGFVIVWAALAVLIIDVVRARPETPAVDRHESATRR